MREKQRVLELIQRQRTKIDLLYTKLASGAEVDLSNAFAGLVDELIEIEEIIDRTPDKYN